MRIGIANSTQVDSLWPLFSQKLQDACEKTGGDISSGEMWQMCRSGNAFLIFSLDDNGFRGGIIVQFQNWPNKHVMRCLGIVGEEMDEWLPSCFDLIKTMAKEGGAKSFVAEGREGWSKIFTDAKKLRVTYEMSFEAPE